ncbi:hypothetical protein E3C22_07845 [Jiella endophytica]|uniref:FAD-binding domain-containing protein n=1 Tax=Jiella endophytica TaxID=2558362 RepID=A0A4Y8RPK1_9HYPH|nr:FAD-dependent monooxygenase [Jiella endophytica]TFF25276.1 hypothetical protein E3C22_07845 [Jiella endophytica]
MTPKDSPRIAIVGAGIAGLTAALCLARLGLGTTIFERAERLEEVGAGLQLSPNALSVMERLGLLPALRKVGVEADRIELLNYRSGRRIAEVPVHSADGTPYLSIHRADLQAVLVDAVKAEPSIGLKLGAELKAVSADEGGVDLSFSSCEALRAELVVAADGVNSTIVRQFGLEGPVATGTTAWRSTIETGGAGQGAPLGLAEERACRVSAWLGPRRHAVAYPIRGGQAVNLVLIARSDDAPAAADRLPAEFSRWDEGLTALIAAAPPPTPWPLYAAPAARPYTVGNGRVVLIGDACHAMAPYAAQGAGMAIEDAAVLAAVIAGTDDLEVAARRFEAERRPRIDRLRGRVGFHRFVYHLPFPFSIGRDTVLALRPRDALRAELAWLYDWRAPDLTASRGG